MVVAALAQGTRLVHVGPQKTGSTALQSALAGAREQLATYGVVYPGPDRKPVRAIEAGLGISAGRGRGGARSAAWRDLLRQLDRPDARVVCLSHEGLGRLTGERLATAARALGGDRPHVVAVARRYDRYLPSQWQQRIKSGKRFSYERWLQIVLDDEHPDRAAYQNVWCAHDTPALVRRWADHVGLDNVTVVAADESDRSQLCRVFEELLDVPPGLLRPDPVHTNRSLSYQEVELVRCINEMLAGTDHADEDWGELFGHGLIPWLTQRPFPEGDDPLPPVPAWARERLVERSAQRVADLRALGVRVIGDLDDLLVPDECPASLQLAPPPTEVSVETAVRAVQGMLRGRIRARELGEHEPTRWVDRIRLRIVQPGP